eukprot:CAMPEP_0201982762 /NCGR_PEP_ID=MMETSP0904-20121228/77942_1 /ASSEMBLY_ACC=CAM_ASM_000553 /TAXON_ID=420261 /ORGANISM="Thalassiosira antarctica, Strain CCMP982" /LENGTH=44 /DNA_ID= /DNA_START= /DNA_END= /DNA_ORIENTATION=
MSCTQSSDGTCANGNGGFLSGFHGALAQLALQLLSADADPTASS